MTNKDYENALKFIIDKHAGQVRKDGTPYVIHPIRVSIALKEKGYGLDYQITGLFHDLLEDTDATKEEIGSYGEEILEAVKLLSKNYSDNKESYIENILKNPMAKAVKEADRNDNLIEAASGHDLEFMTRYMNNTNEYYYEHFDVREAMSILSESIRKEKINREQNALDIKDPELKFYISDNCLFAVKEKTSTAFCYAENQKTWKKYDYYDLFDIELHPIIKDISVDEIKNLIK